MTWRDVRRQAALLLLITILWGCAAEDFSRLHPHTEAEEQAYTRLFPYYVDICATSQIQKKPGFGASDRGGVGGHMGFFLHGACADRDAHYPVLHLCRPGEEDGVGIGMDAHFSSAKWSAARGRSFFFHGGMSPDETLTPARYTQILQQARQDGVLDGISFHDDRFDEKPAAVSDEDWKYQLTAGTDFALGMGRGTYCARVPVSQKDMLQIIDFMNAQNAPYRSGKEVFRWSVFTDNCGHLAHNALNAAEYWPEWPIDRPMLLAIFDFPVPKNEYVNVMMRSQSLPLEDVAALYRDDDIRAMLLSENRLPPGPGVLSVFEPPQARNQVYDVDNLMLLFYDEAIIGRYRHRFQDIQSEPRFYDLHANILWWHDRYAQLIASRHPAEWWLQRLTLTPAGRADFRIFYDRYYEYLDRQLDWTAQALHQLGN
ncbi:hypothetical protein [Granulibacter bethesdensis]|uniref:hypothetical protein n=1 Tax=Granulibacter bethesdensis TaxID=364410 RepID=UPI0009095DB0|nr:hypothetical protein [Granulibacter bethesdensis]APH58807.1 putative secreted protein [Granulibacter bethesdensis]